MTAAVAVKRGRGRPKKGVGVRTLRRDEFKALPPYMIEIEGEQIPFVDFPAIAIGYCRAVLDNVQPACQWIKLACQRYLAMLDMAEDPDCEWYFSAEHVIDYCSVLEKLEHPESGAWVHNQDHALIILEPFQIFIESAIHGFRQKVTDERVVSRALVLLPRKNSKSEIMGGAVAYHSLFAGDKSPQIVIGASTRDQCDRVYHPAKMMVTKEPDLVEKFGIRFNKAGATIEANNGEIILLSSQGQKQDGFNPSLGVLDEFHSVSESLYKVIRSAFGARPNALLRMITTAGYGPSGVGYSVLMEGQKNLLSRKPDYSFFSFIATLDKEDYLDPETNEVLIDKLLTDQSLMQKANPMWGISVSPRLIMQQASEASRSADKRGEFLRTRYNIISSAGATLIDPIQWSACTEPSMRIEHFVDQKCWIGVDLASSLDPCAIGFVFELPNNMVAVFVKYYLPTSSPTFQDPDMVGTYESWASDGFLTATPGVLHDHAKIEEELVEASEVFDVQHIAFDPYQSNMLMKTLWDRDLPVGRYPNNAMTMTAPTDDFIGRVVGKTVRHDGNPVLAWNVANMYGERKGNGSILPRKEVPNSPRKIDGAVALIMANGVRMNPDNLRKDEKELPKRSVYQSRGLIGYSDAN